MVEVVFSYTFQNLRENLASEGLEHRSEDLLRCFRLGTDALLLLSGCGVVFFKVLSPFLCPMSA